MREKILEMVSLLICPFDEMIDKTSIDGMDGVSDDLIPEPIRRLRDHIKEWLRAERSGYENAVVEVVSRHLTEADVDAVLAFNKSETGVKMRGLLGQIQQELVKADGDWRNHALEPHRDEIRTVLGIEEPAPRHDEPPPSAA